MSRMNTALRYIVNFINKRRLKNHSFSLLSNNCNGSLILHDLGLRFNSPFVNLYMVPDDYIKFLKNIDYYLGIDISFLDDTTVSFPVGVLDDIVIYFNHYSSEKEAKEKWNERSKRINFDNLFVMLTERDGCTYQNLCDFDNLTYKNKVAFTHLPHPELQTTYYVKGWEEDGCVRMLFKYKNKYTGKKYYDDFDYVSWFNKKQ